MSNNNSKQTLFLKKIEDLIPASNSMVNVIMDVLDLSMDSAYRRLRGETALNLNEIVTLCNHFKISFDSFINLESGNVTFNYTLMDSGIDSFEQYLRSMLKDLKIIKSPKEKQIIYASEDIPIFHNLNSPYISAFKMFYWMRSIMNLPELANKQFEIDIISDDFKKLGKEIYETYIKIPSIEIWTDTTIQSTIKQVEFYWDSGLFKTPFDAISVCKSLKESIEVIQKQAEMGSKVLDPGKPIEFENNYSLYFSDIEITNNCVLVSMGETKAMYLGHLTFNTMSTSNKTYCNETETWLNNLMKQSTLISGVSVKHRYQFFKAAYGYIDKLIEKINQ